MKIGEKNATYLSLPPNFQTVENLAFGYAVDRQMKKVLAFVKRISVWSDIKNVPPKYYDYLAACLNPPYYASEHDDSTKLNLLENALTSYMFAGTVKAIEDILSKIFGDAEFVPWYEYDGKPYHFKIITTVTPDEETVEKFLKILKRVKAKRSVLDYIETKEYRIEIKTYGNVCMSNYEKWEAVHDKF